MVSAVIRAFTRADSSIATDWLLIISPSTAPRMRTAVSERSVPLNDVCGPITDCTSLPEKEPRPVGCGMRDTDTLTSFVVGLGMVGEIGGAGVAGVAGVAGGGS